MIQQKPSFLVPALVGGVFLGVSSALPLLEFVNCACCALVIGGGILAAFIYNRDYPSDLRPISYGDIAILGMLTGVFGALVWTAVDIPLQLLKFQLGGGLAQLSELEEALNDPQIPQVARDLFHQFVASGGLTVGMTIVSLFLNLVISLIFATLGAIIGLALFQKTPEYRPVAPPPSAPPPPAPPQV